MSSLQYATSGSDGDTRHAMIDEKKRKRMISNRESARRSRMKKQKKMEDLVNQKAQLEIANGKLVEELKNVTAKYVATEAENERLEIEKKKLAETLEVLNYRNSLAMEVPKIGDPFTNPCQLPYQYQNIPEIQPPPSNPLQLLCQSWNIPEFRDPFANPWQFPSSSQPIIASAGMFQF